MLGGFFIILVGSLLFGNPVKGWAPLMIVMLVMGGFQMIMLGLIGEYLWRVLEESRQRPVFIGRSRFTTARGSQS